MKHLSLLLFPLLLACSPQLSESVHDETAGFNGSFESTENGLPANWLLYTARTAGSGDFDWTIDTVGPKAGRRSLACTVRSCNAAGGRFSPGIAQETEAQPGTAYRVSFWTKNNGTTYRVNIHAVSATSHATGILENVAAGSSEWQMHKYIYTMPAGMSRLRFELNVLQPGTFSIDDVRIAPVNRNN